MQTKKTDKKARKALKKAEFQILVRELGLQANIEILSQMMEERRRLDAGIRELEARVLSILNERAK